MERQFETVEAFRSEIRRREASKTDLIVPTRRMRMADPNTILITDNDGVASCGITDYAHGQIADRLGIPRKYYDRAIAVSGLRELNVNAWLNAEPKPVLCRLMDGKVRAFLSDSYKPIDDYLVIEGAALRAFEEFPDVRVTSSSITEARTYLQAVFPRLQGEVRVGEPVQMGVTIRNSEVGAGAVDIESFIYVLKCKNGMIGTSLFRKIHMGKRTGEELDVRSYFSDETIIAELKAFRRRLADIIRNELTDVAFDAKLTQMKIAAGEPVHAPEETVKNVTKRWALGDETGKAVLANFIDGRDYTRWGLSNAVTWQAHAETSADRQYDLEKVGGEIIELTPAQWELVVA